MATNKSENERVQRTERYAEQVRRTFAVTINEILTIKKTLPDTSKGVMYTFAGDTNKVQSQVNVLLKRLHSTIYTAIKNGIVLEWGQAEKIQTEIENAVNKITTTPQQKAEQEENRTQTILASIRNTQAMNQFIKRSSEGLNLSQRVWNYTNQLRDEMEVAITVAIGEGRSAQQMSRDVRKYLNDPDLMFRRFQYKGDDGVIHTKWKKKYIDEKGHVRFADCDRDTYKTGPGVYKSSYKNAMRLTRTETNMAYRNSDYFRWLQNDQIIGIYVRPSNAPQGKDHHERVEDICDDLKGQYPKNFRFEGWHPNCFCIATPIFIPANERKAQEDALVRGEHYNSPSLITKYPKGFIKWTKDHEWKKNLAQLKGKPGPQDPYFITHNKGIMSRLAVQERHEGRTQAQIDAIKQRWLVRQQARGVIAPPPATTTTPTPIQTPMAVTTTNATPKATNEVQALFEKVQKIPSYIPDSNQYNIQQRGEHIVQNLKTFFGTDYNTPRGVGGTLSLHLENIIKAQKAGTPYTFTEDEINRLIPYMNIGKHLIATIDHLSELRTITDIRTIHGTWVQPFKELIQTLQNVDFTKEGICNYYAKIEGAYNIYKLSINKDAITYGLDKLSYKMPYNMFTEVAKKVPGWTTADLPQKAFFDKLKDFVPLRTDAKDPAYYNPTQKTVYINLDKMMNRLVYSKWERKGLFYHEFGHAYDEQVGMSTDPELQAIFKKFKKMMNEVKEGESFSEGQKLADKLNTNQLEKMGRFNRRWDKLSEKDKKYKMKEVERDNYLCLYDEPLGGFSDCLQAMLKGHPWTQPRGHNISYWTKEQQLAEFIAHASENYWNGNIYFEFIAPELYKMMCEYIKTH